MLLLLAELGFIGIFIAGGTFFTNDAGIPVLPVRDRAAEWGQMLAGARDYAFEQQWVAFVPAVVAAAAISAFNLLGEGLRAALDPFGARRLSPRSLGLAGRGLGILLAVGIVGVGGAALAERGGELSVEEGRRRATEAAERVAPGAMLVASVVRFSSAEFALSRPEKLNYYFTAPGQSGVLRVGFVGADPHAAEVQRFHNDDRLETRELQPLMETALPWQQALATPNSMGAPAFGPAGQRGSSSWSPSSGRVGPRRCTACSTAPA